MAREASRGSFLSATFSLLPCVAPAEFDADFVQPRFQCAVEFAIRRGQGVGQLHGTAGCNVVGPKRNASALACPAVQALLPDGRRESLIRRYNAPCPNARSYP